MISSGGPHPCPSCGASVDARYCPECGERRIHDGEWSLRRFLSDALRELLGGADSRLWQSFRLLALRPGALTREHLRGRRRPYLKPIQLFLLANLFYFFVQPLTGYTGYNTPLRSQMERQYYSAPAGLEARAIEQAAERGIELEMYAQLYDLQSGNLAKTLIIFMVPLLALVLALLLFPLGRPLVQHLVFALHYFAWELVFVSSLFLLLWGHVLGLANAIAPGWREIGELGWAGETVVVLATEMATAPLILVYCYLATRRAYGLSRFAAALVAAAVYPALLAITLCYRFSLFWITFATV